MADKFSHGYALLIGVGESASKLSLPVTVKDTQAIYAEAVKNKFCPEPQVTALSMK